MMDSLPPFQRKRICIVGICTVDAVAQHIDDYPPRGGLRLFDSLKLTTGGNAVNCAIALGKMGLAASIVTKVGSDPNAELILSELARYGVDTRGVIRSSDSHTPFSFVCVHRDGQRSFLHTVGTNGTLRLDEIDRVRVRRADLCFVTGAMLMPRFDGPPTAELLRDARQAGALTVLDTSFVDSAGSDRWRAVVDPCLPHLDYFAPSRLEARALTGQEDPARAAEYILRGGCRNAVIKLDAEGVYYRDASGSGGVVPAYPVPAVVDTTGAGDCWCAGFLAGLAQELPLPDALRLGNAVAAHCIQHPGASSGVPPLEAIRRFQATS